MRKAGVIIAAAVFCVSLTATVSAAEQKVAYVDLSRIFSEYGKTEVYDEQLTKRETAYKQERDKKAGEIRKFQDKLRLMGEEEQKAKQKDLEEQISDLREFDSAKQQELRKEQDKRMKEILKDIEDTVQKYAQEQGYTFVLNDRVLIYQDSSMDITAAILERLNKQFKK